MKLINRFIPIVSIVLALSQPAFAVTGWVGTATYDTTPTPTTTGTFDTYDFGSGLALIEMDTSGVTKTGTGLGTVYSGTGAITGYYQSIINSHSLAGTGLVVPGLNLTGAGSGFELTFAANFTGEATFGDSGATFDISGGNVNLYFDDSPDYSFYSDTGFNDGDAILTGTISSGFGAILLPFGSGFEQVELDFSGALGFDPAVFEPDTIVGGSQIFTIKTDSPFNSTPLIDLVGSSGAAGTVQGQAHADNVGLDGLGSVLAETSGTMQLTAVPVPAAVWLFGSSMLGLLVAGRRKTH